jgi:hypothetical protein
MLVAVIAPGLTMAFISAPLYCSTATIELKTCGKQLRGDRAFEHEPVGAGAHHRSRDFGLVVDAQDDDLRVGAAFVEAGDPAEPAVAGQGQIHDRDGRPEPE